MTSGRERKTKWKRFGSLIYNCRRLPGDSRHNGPLNQTVQSGFTGTPHDMLCLRHRLVLSFATQFDLAQFPQPH
jgi:hypothetical protein